MKQIPNWMQFPGVLTLIITVAVGWPFLTPVPWVLGPLWWGFLLWRLIAGVRRARMRA